MRIVRDSGLYVCDHCGGQQEASAAATHIELLDETSRRCPSCSSLLSASRLEEQSFLCCARCFGMLIEMNRFAAVIEAMRALEERSVQTPLSRRQNPADRRIDCPSCGRTMRAHLYAGPGNVVIDTCDHCLVNWLDPGELRRIAIAPDSSRRRSEQEDFSLTPDPGHAADDD